MNKTQSNTPVNQLCIQALLNGMWENYLELNPDARRIYNLFSEINDGSVINDHIALRTFNLDKVNVDKIAQPFIDAGYTEKGEYDFSTKKLRAKHYEHEDTSLPKVFISELRTEEFSQTTQGIISSLVSQISEEQVKEPDFSYSGRPWSVSADEYQTLLKESEYAAWMAAFGYRPNHFTVFVNYLKKMDSIKAVNHFLLENGFRLNESGGVIKGSPEVYLEQSSTMANEVDITFSDGKILHIPSCYYEFAKRYPLPNGELYEGFVATSADKIFESTNKQ